MPIYPASIAYAARGESKIHVPHVLNDVPEELFDQKLYVSIRKKVGSDKEERVQDWPGEREDFDFVPLPENRVEHNPRDYGLDLYLPPKLNDPLALDLGTGQFVLRLRFGSEGNIYECLMQMQAGADGELYLIASDKTPRAQPKSTVQRPEKATGLKAGSAPGGLNVMRSFSSLNTEQRKRVLLAGALALLVLLILLFVLLDRQGQEGEQQPPAQPAASNVVKLPKPEPRQEPVAQPASQEQASESTAKQANPQPVTADSSAGQTDLQTQESAESSLESVPCSLKGTSGQSDQALLSTCLKSGAQSETLYEFAREALGEGRCDLTKRILTSQGRGGHAPSALLMARLYDPKDSESSSCVQKNTEQAVYWYQKRWRQESRPTLRLLWRNYNMRIKFSALLLSSLLMGITAAKALSAPLLLEGKESIYQRVLTTPGCELRKTPGAGQGQKVPAFSRFYVYSRDQGKLQVGSDTQGSIVGYLNEDCTVDWKMQTALMFTNPAGRQRSLIFKDQEQLSKLVFDEKGSQEARALYDTLSSKGQAEGVIAQEPDKYVDYKEHFYLLPVLDSVESMFDDGNYVRELKVASVTARPQEQAAKTEEAVAIRAFKAALVFVIDSSISMQPYIDRTKQAISQIYKRIEKEQLQGAVQFGLVSFRSSTQAVPALEYVSKLFVNPGQATSVSEFEEQLKNLNQARVSSALFDEDAYSGIATALNEVDWQKFGGRYVVLITDAGAIEGQNSLSSTKLDSRELRLEAAQRGIALYTLHLKTPSGARNHNHEKAQSQYEDLTYNEVLHKPLYYPVDAGSVESFGSMIDELSEAITSQVKQASEGKLAPGSALSRTEEPEKSAATSTLQEDAALLGHAMQLAYLGKVTGTRVPTTLQGWIADRDLIDHRLPTATPVVLLTKLQLSDLKDLTRHILDAANQGLLNPEDMFSQLRSLAVSMGRDPNQLSDNKVLKLSELGLLGEYLEGLPYKSRLQSLDEETWSSMGPDEQNQTIEDLERKLQYYQLCHDDTDRWVSLNELSDPSESVYPIPLEELP